jgi:uncharacterized membrane protein YbjE (DUF340 family)
MEKEAVQLHTQALLGYHSFVLAELGIGVAAGLAVDVEVDIAVALAAGFGVDIAAGIAVAEPSLHLSSPPFPFCGDAWLLQHPLRHHLTLHGAQF